jgi:hypothetical protein
LFLLTDGCNTRNTTCSFRVKILISKIAFLQTQKLAQLKI